MMKECYKNGNAKTNLKDTRFFEISLCKVIIKKILFVITRKIKSKIKSTYKYFQFG